LESQERIRILLVDDRLENLSALESVLTSPEYELVRAQSGADALRFLLHQDCALILLDVQMPGMDGYEVARLVRGNARTKNIPIIFVTAINKESRYVAKGYESGAVDYMFKPYDPDILRSKVAVFAELYRSRQEMARQAKLLREHERTERMRELAELELTSLRRERIAQHRYRELVEGVTHAVIWSAEPLTLLCTYVSPSAELILGCPAETWLEPNFWRCRLHPAELQETVALMTRLREGEVKVFEHRLLNGRGEWSWFQTSLRLVSEEDGGVELRGFSVDITQARQGEEALQFLARASSELFSSLDLRQTTRCVAALVVPFLADWCSVTITPEGGGDAMHSVVHRDTSKEKSALELHFHPDIRRLAEAPDVCVAAGLADLLAGEGDFADAVRELSPGSVVIVPLATRGRRFGVMELFCQSGASKFDRYHLTLAEEIGRRGSQAIENALLYGQAREAIAVREEFLSIASHELKTPMTPLQLQMQSLARLVESELGDAAVAEKLLKRLRTSERHLRRLDDLVEELLDVARLRTGRMRLQLESVDLRGLIAEVVGRQRDALDLAKRAVVTKVAEQMTGQWDRLRLDQVLTNLLSNAIKYGDASPIRIEASCRDGGVAVAVMDEGIGISEAEKGRIFEPFERGSVTKDYGGLGLGLYIVRQIVEAHGGRISVESQLGRGSTFTLWLPLLPASERHRGEVHTPQVRSSTRPTAAALPKSS
jgi:PAS domain S-box-containing protein